MMICGKDYPVIGQVETSGGVSVPLVDVPMMDDEKWQREAARKHRGERIRIGETTLGRPRTHTTTDI